MTTQDQAQANVDTDSNVPRTAATSSPRPAIMPPPQGPIFRDMPLINDDQYEPSESEKKLVNDWLEKIKVSRAFDDEVRKMYASDRKYARGDSSFKVRFSLIQTYIDILVSFLAARDPDFDCLPADGLGEASLKDAEDWGKTMSVVIRSLLKSAKLKRVAGKVVRSSLTVGIGWLKAVWYEDWQTNPQVKDTIRDLQRNLAMIKAKQAEIASGDVEDLEKAQAELEQQIKGASSGAEKLIARGMSLAMINPEDMTIASESENVIDQEMAPWMAQRFFVRLDVGQADYPHIPKEKLASAAMYRPRKPLSRGDRNTSAAVADINDGDADAYTKGGEGNGKGPKFLCCHEVWDSDSNQFLTVIEGLECWGEAPALPPVPATRFYPFFSLAFTEVDGERHPQSLVSRSGKLQDEIERCLDALINHRSRVKPGLLYDMTKLDRNSINRLTRNESAANIGVRSIGGKEVDLNKVLVEKKYNRIDPGLYDIEPYIRRMETIWGIQEALTSSVSVPKTATEAEIQQAGTQAKSGFKRDILEDMLTDLAQYTAENAAFKLDLPAVQQIAGVGAFWIQIDSVDELYMLMQIDVRAGSSGKPDTAARRAAWSAMLPQIKEMMLAIADYRQTQPDALADNMEQLLLETGERVGERIDMKRFIPQVNPNAIRDPVTGQVLTNTQVGAMRAAAMESQLGGADGKSAGGGDGKTKASRGGPPDGGGVSDQAQVAPTAVPAAVAG